MISKTKISSSTDRRFILNPLFVSPSQIYAASRGSVKEITGNSLAATYTLMDQEKCIAFLPDLSLMAVASND